MSKVHGTYTPTMLGSPTLVDANPFTRYSNYGSGGFVPNAYGFQYGEWVSESITINGTNLYKVYVNVACNPQWGAIGNNPRVTITLPFPSYYDNTFFNTVWQNAEGQGNAISWVNSGQTMAISDYKNTWVASTMGDHFTFQLEYYTLTAPS